MRTRTVIAFACGIAVSGAALGLWLASEEAETRAGPGPSVAAARGPVPDAPDNPAAQLPSPGAGTEQVEIAEAPSQSGAQFETVLEIPWGDGPGQVGRRLADESAPEGPMSFVVTDDGRLVLLDQVNQRVQVFDPDQPPTSVALPADTYEDLDLDKDGNLVVIDRLARRSIETFGPDGKLLSSVALQGPGVPDGGGVTGLFSRPDGTWVEVEHQRLVRVADASGRADPDRPELPGRFSADGSRLLLASREGPQAVVILGRPADAPQQAPVLIARIGFSLPVWHLTGLESDHLGRIYLGALAVRERPVPPHDALEAHEEIVVLSAAGIELGRARLAAASGPEEQFRSLRLGGDGFLYLLRCAQAGVELRRLML